MIIKRPFSSPSSNTYMVKAAKQAILAFSVFVLLIICIMLGSLTVFILRIRSGLPTAGPVSAGGSGNGLQGQIQANINCAEIGEQVTFSITFMNLSREPLVMLEPDQFDIVLQPVAWDRPEQQPIRRWSDTDQYPSSIDTELAPGERQVYQWHWTAEADFAQRIPARNAVNATLIRGDFSMRGAILPGGETSIGIGIGSYPWVNGGSFTCAELRENNNNQYIWQYPWR